MKRHSITAVIFSAFTLVSQAGVSIDETTLGKSLGGWNKQGGKVAEYPLSGADYRTYRPEISPTPDGGIFISIRIDHVRGWLSSNDHAMLEITVDSEGKVASAQSSIAIQGRSVSSDLIRGGNLASQQVAGVDRAVQIGTDLIADVSAKMLREKIVEAGRVSFPAALRHNYNLLYQSIIVDKEESAVSPPNPLDPPAVDSAKEEPAKEEPAKKEPAIPKAKALDIKPYSNGG